MVGLAGSRGNLQRAVQRGRLWWPSRLPLGLWRRYLRRSSARGRSFCALFVRFLAGAVAVCNGFAVVAGLERLGGGVDGVAVGASVGSHIDAAGNG